MNVVINSAKLGQLTIDTDRIITFPEGIPGFPWVKQYALIDNDKGRPFFCLQAVEDPELAFVVTDPFSFKQDYRPSVPADELNNLEIHDPEYLVILVIVTVSHEDPLKLTANFMAPLVINSRTRRASQVILYNADYNHREPLLAPITSDTS